MKIKTVDKIIKWLNKQQSINLNLNVALNVNIAAIFDRSFERRPSKDSSSQVW
jgi:hypothetical protein